MKRIARLAGLLILLLPAFGRAELLEMRQSIFGMD